MAGPSSPKPKRELLPPNLVAFLAGVVLALAVGMIFRKWIERMDTHATVMRALSPEDAAAKNKKSEMVLMGEKSTLPSASANTEDTRKAKNKEAVAPVAATDSSNKSELQDPAANAELQTSLVQEERISENAAGEVDYITWRRQFRTFEEQLNAQGINNLSVTMTPRYRHQAKGLAITRGQFLDVVSKKVPANLPTRQANLGMVLYALSPVDFDPQQFSRVARDTTGQIEPLCRSGATPLKLTGVERLTILISNAPQYYKCLNELFERNPEFLQIQEVTFVGFTRGSTFFASLSAQKKLISLQMWNPDWLLDNTVGLEETGSELPRVRRALRLANVTRALGQPSDVRMQIPASFRPLAGPYSDPTNPTPPKPFVVGNFALVPSHMPRGSLIATAFTNPGQDRSKSATVKPPGVGKTKALVLATQGKKLQFMSVTRE
jgi:hypothetical protein